MKTTIHAVLAIVVTLALFWVMQFLIAEDAIAVTPGDPPPSVDIVRAPPPEPPPPVRPQPPDEPEPRPQRPPDDNTRTDVDGPDWSPNIGIPKNPDGGERGTALLPDGDPVPVITIPPQYPRDLLIAGVEGWVRIEFTVEADGSVSNPRVIMSEPQRVFDRAALAALTQWRFRPKMVNGQPVPSRAAYTIAFELDDR